MKEFKAQQMIGRTFFALALACAITLLVHPNTARAATVTTGTWQIESLNGMSYRLLLPANYNSAVAYPVMLFLHGSGAQLPDNVAVPRTAGTDFNTVDFRSKFPVIIIAPQCTACTNVLTTWGGDVPGYVPEPETQAIGIVQYILSKYNVNHHRVYVTGFSMGGIGTWDMIARYNSLFTAAMPISGATFGSRDYPAYYSTNDKELLDTPIWAFHGGADTTVPPTYDRANYAEITKLGGKLMKYTEYAGLGHTGWDKTYLNDTNMAWLFEQSR